MFFRTGSTNSTSFFSREVYLLFWYIVWFFTIPKCYKDIYVNSFFPRTAGLWNFLPMKCFPLIYDLRGFKSRINKHLLTVGSLYFNLFVLLFLIIPCLIVAVQASMEWIPIFKKVFDELSFWWYFGFKRNKLKCNFHYVAISKMMSLNLKLRGFTKTQKCIYLENKTFFLDMKNSLITHDKKYFCSGSNL